MFIHSLIWNSFIGNNFYNEIQPTYWLYNWFRSCRNYHFEFAFFITTIFIPIYLFISPFAHSDFCLFFFFHLSKFFAQLNDGWLANIKICHSACNWVYCRGRDKRSMTSHILIAAANIIEFIKSVGVCDCTQLNIQLEIQVHWIVSRFNSQNSTDDDPSSIYKCCVHQKHILRSFISNSINSSRINEILHIFNLQTEFIFFLYQ